MSSRPPEDAISTLSGEMAGTTSLPEDVASALSWLSDKLGSGLDLVDFIGDVVGSRLVEMRWFTALSGSIAVVNQLFFIWEAINLVVEAGEYDQRVAESAGAAAGIVALAMGEPIPAAPRGWADPDGKLANSFRTWALDSQRRVKEILEPARPRRLLTIHVQVGVGEISSTTIKQRAAAMVALLLACQRDPSNSMDMLFHKFAETNVTPMGEPYDSALRNRHYWWPPL